MLPDPLIFTRPLHVWLGIVIYLLLIVQILTGTKMIRIPFWWHRKVIWVAILVIATLHGIYGYQLYF